MKKGPETTGALGKGFEMTFDNPRDNKAQFAVLPVHGSAVLPASRYVLWTRSPGFSMNRAWRSIWRSSESSYEQL